MLRLLVLFLFCCDAGLIFAAEATSPRPTAPQPNPLVSNYFVAPTGSDQNPGSIDRPFASLQRALNLVKPGQVICLRGGTYLPATTTQFKTSGQPGASIEVRSFPGEFPVIDGASLPGDSVTWRFAKTGHWRIRGPIHLTNGRGAGVYVDHDSLNVSFDQVETSYNGKAAARGGHGFMVQGPNIKDITFQNCDAHHNANHKTLPGENVEDNIYQHGDGFRIFDGINVRLNGCRAWYNLDDGYDLTQAREPVELRECWAAYSGIDDAKGSITGKPNWGIRRYDGEGFKLGYKDDRGQHRAYRCLSWNNFSYGWNVAGGPCKIINCGSYNNGEDGFFGYTLQASEMRNCYALKNRVGDGIWIQNATGTTVSPEAFVALKDDGMLGPRQADGSLPDTDFLRPAKRGRLTDEGVDVGLPFKGRAIDIGPRETP